MSDDRGASLSSAFDALLDKNWQRLDALSSTSSGERPKTARPVQPAAAAPEPIKGERRSGRSDGIDFKFEV